jgi:hypothetical protein
VGGCADTLIQAAGHAEAEVHHVESIALQHADAGMIMIGRRFLDLSTNASWVL